MIFRNPALTALSTRMHHCLNWQPVNLTTLFCLARRNAVWLKIYLTRSLLRVDNSIGCWLWNVFEQVSFPTFISGEWSVFAVYKSSTQKAHIIYPWLETSFSLGCRKFLNYLKYCFSSTYCGDMLDCCNMSSTLEEKIEQMKNCSLDLYIEDCVYSRR